MKLLALAALAVPLAVLVLPMGNTPPANPDDEAIRITVTQYFDGMMQANPTLLRTAFHAEARLIGPRDDGTVWLIPVGQWADSWEGRDHRDPARYRNRIVSVDVSGDAAVAKTELVWPDVTYVDYLSLLRVGGEWKIVNKIWTEER